MCKGKGFHMKSKIAFDFTRQKLPREPTGRRGLLLILVDNDKRRSEEGKK